MAKVALQRGDVRVEVPLGFSFSMFFLSMIFGCILFYRGLVKLGIIIAAMQTLTIYLTYALTLPKVIDLHFALIACALFTANFALTCLHIFCGAKGNEIWAKHLLNEGYTFVPPATREEASILARARILFDIDVPPRSIRDPLFIRFVNYELKSVRRVKVGFSFTLYFFCFVFGIPFLLRGMYKTALACSILLGCLIFAPNIQMMMLLYYAMCGGCIFFGVKGNEITARYYLQNGYIMDEDTTTSKIARAKWGL